MKPLLTFLEQKENSVLCIVAETKGSCPGRVGFKMLVYNNKGSIGSIGGGSMEFKVIADSIKMLKQKETTAKLLSFEHTSMAEPEEQSGMICSGNQKIILIPTKSKTIQTNQKEIMQVTKDGIFFHTKIPSKMGLVISADKKWEYFEEIKPKPTVYIFGGGHCSLALTRILYSLDMQVVIIDDRKKIWTMQENNLATKKIVCSYEKVDHLVKEKSIVVIMTASHQGEVKVLQQMLNKNLLYIGMMASKTTSKFIFNEMLKLGFTQEQLNTINTPIGIPISSQTPAEIAVSIAAELIKKRLTK